MARLPFDGSEHASPQTKESTRTELQPHWAQRSNDHRAIGMVDDRASSPLEVGIVKPSRLIVSSGDKVTGDVRTSPGAAREQLFRHKFIVGSDFLIRVPLEGATLLRAFVTYEHLCGVLQEKLRTMTITDVQALTILLRPVQLTLEAHRPQHTMRWSRDALRMLSLPNAGGSSIASEVLSFEVMSRAFGAKLDRTETELKYLPGKQP